jgi:branched-chain amino acid transport system ATP-binding protein
MPYFSNEFRPHLKCYYGDQIAIFGDYVILHNIGKHTPVGIPLAMSNSNTTLSTEITHYYEEKFLPMFASLPQKAFNNIAKDCNTLNRLEDSNTGLRYIFDYANPNNFVIKNNKILITDEIICQNKVGNSTADLLRVQAYNAIKYGVAHVPEGRQIFANLTVQENLEMGAYKRHNAIKIKSDLKEVFERFPRLEERKKQKAGTLSGGEQQMLAMARAMMSKPKILLLDEPSMGLSPIFVNEIFDIIKHLHETGITILLVEQNAKAALSIADRAYVLESGNVVLSGTGKELLDNEKVKEAYLGA